MVVEDKLLVTIKWQIFSIAPSSPTNLSSLKIASPIVSVPGFCLYCVPFSDSLLLLEELESFILSRFPSIAYVSRAFEHNWP